MSQAKLTALYDRIMAAGGNAMALSIEGTPAVQNDNIERVQHYEGEWVVAYWERGQLGSIVFRSKSADDAIAYYESRQNPSEHRHTIAYHRDLALIDALEVKLKTAEIHYTRETSTVFFGRAEKYAKIHVLGPEIFRVEAAFGKRLIIMDHP